jgi:hypothetical protein
VRRGYRQAAALGVFKFLRDLPHVFNVGERAVHQLNNGLSRRCNAGQLLARALEDLHPQLVLQLPDLLTDAWLRGVQALGGGRDIEAMPGDGGDVTQLA